MLDCGEYFKANHIKRNGVLVSRTKHISKSGRRCRGHECSIWTQFLGVKQPLQVVLSILNLHFNYVYMHFRLSKYKPITGLPNAITKHALAKMSGLELHHPNLRLRPKASHSSLSSAPYQSKR